MDSLQKLSSETNRRTILVIDDEQDIVTMLADLFDREGYRVLTASDGRSGIEIAKSHSPDVVLLDLGLPDIEGHDAITQIKTYESLSSVPIIVITGRIGSHDVVRAFEAGASDYLRKPLDPHSLKARIQFMCDLNDPEREIDSIISYLHEEVHQKTEHVRLLYGLTHDFNNSDSLEDVLERFVEALHLTAQSNRISVYLRTEDGDMLEFKAGIGIPDDLEQFSLIPVNWGVAGQVYSSRQAVTNVDYKNTSLSSSGRYNSNHFYSLPILVRKKAWEPEVLGVVNITDRKNDRPFSTEELECIQSITSAAAIAIQHQLAITQHSSSISVLLRTIGRLAEYRDEETASHLERVPQITRIIATELATANEFSDIITQEYLNNLVQAAPLHDIGKIGIPDAILTKDGPLTAREMQIMRTHTTIGKQILELAVDHSGMTSLLKMCIEISYSHHERWDGCGYPRRIAEREIPLSARILAVADAYDAITSRRCYKISSPHEAAVQIIQNDAGKHFDPVVAEAFMRTKETIRDYCETVSRDYTQHYVNA